MIRITDIHLPVDYTNDDLENKICQSLKISKKAVNKFSLFRRSIDARKKKDIHFIITADVYLNTNEHSVISKAKCKNAQIKEEYKYQIQKFGKKISKSPVIVGAGPAGLFAALILAKSGAEPILIERGKSVDERLKDVDLFWKTGILNTNSNVQFGEGGAGTFSDGKLNTGTKDVRARTVLTEFAKHGADKEILYNAKPHIGTDKLRDTVKNIRSEIIELGGKVMFDTTLIGIKTANSKVTGVEVLHNGTKEIIDTDSIILAIGHSARDTFEYLYNFGIPVKQKAFSIGARIEHLRDKIDKSQYGDFAGNEKLGAAPYKLNVHLKNGRGVYTFCMCPGGRVVAAASEDKMLVTNGMSNFSRDEINSNSALLVGINPDDFGSEHKLAGMYLQRKLEQKAYIAGGESYNAPVQRVGDFLKNVKSSFFGNVLPSYKPGTVFCKMDNVLPEYICDSMRQAILLMNNRLQGFSDNDALLTGIETRSSSPIRILRDENMESVKIKGLYPCGEGAGYAGGIVSAAVDGIKCAEKIIEKSNKD